MANETLVRAFHVAVRTDLSGRQADLDSGVLQKGAHRLIGRPNVGGTDCYRAAFEAWLRPAA
ncbi:hypothetical protein OH687_10160 [Burkholderia anthina]|nr:hypothetical protein OH687_10160 [Burkholderia anthina]